MNYSTIYTKSTIFKKKLTIFKELVTILTFSYTNYGYTNKSTSFST